MTNFLLLLRTRWITASSADRTIKRYNQFIKDVYSSMKSFATNERMDDLYIGLYIKLPFSTGDRFCRMEMLVESRDFSITEEASRSVFSGSENNTL